MVSMSWNLLAGPGIACHSAIVLWALSPLMSLGPKPQPAVAATSCQIPSLLCMCACARAHVICSPACCPLPCLLLSPRLPCSGSSSGAGEEGSKRRIAAGVRSRPQGPRCRAFDQTWQTVTCAAGITHATGTHMLLPYPTASPMVQGNRNQVPALPRRCNHHPFVSSPLVTLMSGIVCVESRVLVAATRTAGMHAAVNAAFAQMCSAMRLCRGGCSAEEWQWQWGLGCSVVTAWVAVAPLLSGSVATHCGHTSPRILPAPHQGKAHQCVSVCVCICMCPC